MSLPIPYAGEFWLFLEGGGASPPKEIDKEIKVLFLELFCS